MSFRLAIAAVAALLAGCVVGPASTLKLADFDVVGDAVWTEATGELIPQRDSGVGYLVHRANIGDIDIELEFFVEEDTNSGVFARCGDVDNITPMTCYEFNIWDQHPNQKFRTGALVAIAEPLAHVNTVGRWNRYRVSLKGRQLEAWINDVKTVDERHDALSSGRVALQYGGEGMVRFRNVVIR